MISRSDVWTRGHDLALIYIALAYGTDYHLSENELDTIVGTLDAWGEELGIDDAREVVREAMRRYVEEDSDEVCTESMTAIKEAFGGDERRRALEGLMRIAEADGILLDRERSMISRLAEVWEIRATGRRLLEVSEASPENRSWSLMHDISLIYVVLAHSTDNELSPPEIDAILLRIRDWQPEFGEEEARGLLRETLEYYGADPGEEALRRSVETIKKGLSVVQRLVLLDDLVYIAEVDGGLSGNEKNMISNLARAWRVGVRMNGAAAHSG